LLWYSVEEEAQDLPANSQATTESTLAPVLEQSSAGMAATLLLQVRKNPGAFEKSSSIREGL
jgi:hypothetical protein